MPAIVAIFIALQILHVPNLLRSVTQGVDPRTRTKTSATPVSFTLTTAPWREHTADRKGGCDFQLLARVTGRGHVRARIDSVEQLLDEAWTPRHRIKGGEKVEFTVEFLEPIGGQLLAEREVSFSCRKSDTRPEYRAPDLSHIP